MRTRLALAALLAPTALHAQPRANAGVRGTAYDAQGEPALEVTVMVPDSPHRTRTDLDGRYELRLPPGRYTVRLVFDRTRHAERADVEVREGAFTDLDLRLGEAPTPAPTPTPPAPQPAAPQTDPSTSPPATPVTPAPPAAPAPPAPPPPRAPSGETPRESGEAGAMVIRGRADRGTTATQLQVRRQTAAVSDGVSAQEIARAPDAAVSDAARRVVGVTLVNGRYAYVRGLGGRYVNALLNGMPLPSLDPDEPGVQLDVLPASLLSGLNVFKSFTPDMPGDFAGGSLQLSSRDYPERFTLTVGLSGGFDSLTHTGRVQAGSGSATDLLGFDDGRRALPAAVPARRVDVGNALTLDDVTRIGRALPDDWTIRRRAALPSLGLSLSAGGTARVRGRPLGLLVALTWNAGESLQRDALGQVRRGGTTDAPRLEYREQQTQETLQTDALWGALATASLAVSPRDEVSLVALWAQSSTDATLVRQGYNETLGQNFLQRTLRFTQRSMGVAQLNGDHRDRFGRDSRVRWQLFGDVALRREPDVRDAVYRRDDLGAYQITTGPGNLGRLWSDLDVREVGGNVDVTIPIRAFALRLGGMVRLGERGFSLRRFAYRYDPANGPAPSELELPPGEFLAPARLGRDLQLVEYTDRFDGYTASQALYAPFLRADYTRGGTREEPTLRVTAGARVEVFSQQVTSQSPFAEAGVVTAPRVTDRTDPNVLPAASVSWAVSPTMTLRAAYGATLARPIVREVAPFLYPDFVRNRTVQGNPDLRTTSVHNADLRWELYPGRGEVIAASVFYKHFLDPIERVILDRNGNVTYDNVDGAQNFGAELEARISLGRLARPLRAVYLNVNASLIYSRVTLSPTQQVNATNAERPLAGQSPWVVNAGLRYEPSPRFSASVFYNVFGARIEDVGRFGLPDTYREPVHQLDAAVQWDPSPRFGLRLAARNLALQPLVFTQGPLEVLRRDAAMSLSLRAQFTY
ncbi:MAG: TonB-dependent receptor [Polyangiales bacterium]